MFVNKTFYHYFKFFSNVKNIFMKILTFLYQFSIRYFNIVTSKYFQKDHLYTIFHEIKCRQLFCRQLKTKKNLNNLFSRHLVILKVWKSLNTCITIENITLYIQYIYCLHLMHHVCTYTVGFHQHILVAYFVFNRKVT